jgi:hypothetical protein
MKLFGEKWLIIDYLKFVTVNELKTLIGIQVTVGLTHTMSLAVLVIIDN